MSKTNKYFFEISIFSLLGGIYLFPEKIKIITIIAVISVIICYLQKRRYKLINRNNAVGWIIFLVLGSFISIINNIGIFTAIEFSISLLIGLLLSIFYMNKTRREIAIKAILMVTLVAFVGCILQLLVPDFLSTITNKTLGSGKYYYFQDFLSYGALVGFSYQTGVTGFYLAILDGIILCYFFGKKDKSRILSMALIVAFVGVYIMILLTRKRSQLLAVILLTIFLFSLYNRKDVLKILGITSIMILGVVLLLNFTKVGQTIIGRSIGSNPLSSRNSIYLILWNNFVKSPLWGNGFGYTLDSVKQFTNGHNIYLQVLSENGLIGFSLFVGIMWVYFKQALLCLKRKMLLKGDSYMVSIPVYIEGLFILNGFIGNPLYDVYPLFIFLICTGIISSELLDLRIKGVCCLK